MPVATVRGVDINYEVLGERGPWVALQPGGRRGGRYLSLGLARGPAAAADGAVAGASAAGRPGRKVIARS